MKNYMEREFNMEAKIVFKNGTELMTEMNGSSFIVDERPAFPDDLSTINVITEQGERVLHNVIAAECASVDGRFWFGFIEQSQEDMTQEKRDAQILFKALMTDTLIEEEI